MDREAFGFGDRYANMNPTSEPAIDKDLIGKWLDVCLQCFLDDGVTEILWIQGKIILVSYGTNIPMHQGQQACYKAGKAVMIPWEKNK